MPPSFCGNRFSRRFSRIPVPETIVTVKPNRAAPFFARHPWVHERSILPLPDGLEVGESVDLVTHDGKWIGRGLVNPGSHLPVRLYSWDPAERIDDALVDTRIRLAIARRRPLGLNGPEDALRVVYSESDGLSGLIVDRYGEYLVVQINAAVWMPRLSRVLQSLDELLRPKGVVLKVDDLTAQAESIQEREEMVAGTPPDGPIPVRDGEVRLAVDLLGTQKTGLYLDQRENRLAAARYMADRRVLDVCCYAGGFGLAALISGGARQVLGIDGSQRALDAAAENARRNQLEAIQFERADCFDYLKAAAAENRQFDAVVLDPPRFAGHRRGVAAALRAYHRLNLSAVRLLPPGGILVTCSCSGRVSRPDFLNMLVEVGRRARRDIIVLENRNAAPDHPMAISCPETDYLKCFICEIR